jgi:hypothetical protein
MPLTYIQKKILDSSTNTEEEVFSHLDRSDIEFPYVSTIDPANGKQIWSHHGHQYGELEILQQSIDGTYNLHYTSVDKVFSLCAVSITGKVIGPSSVATDKILVNASGSLFYKFPGLAASNLAIRNRLIGTIYDNQNNAVRSEKLDEFYFVNDFNDSDNLIYWGYNGYHANLDFNYTFILEGDQGFELTNQIYGLTGSGLQMEANGFINIDERQFWKEA